MISAGKGSKALFGGTVNVEAAKDIARKVLDIYDLDRDGIIGFHEIPEVLKDAYKSINKSIEVSQGEQESMHAIMDKNKDGKINIQDLEALAI